MTNPTERPAANKEQAASLSNGLAKQRIVVYHAGYGCDTGCCGHVVEMDGGGGKFHFDHPYGGDSRVFAEALVREEFGEEHVADLDWETCMVSDV